MVNTIFKVGEEVFYDGDPNKKYIITEIKRNENVMNVIFYRGFDSNGNFITRTQDHIAKIEKEREENVKCKYCKYCENEEDYNYCNKWLRETKEDWSCSRGDPDEY